MQSFFYLLHVAVVVSHVLVLQPLDDVLPAHAQVRLVQVDDPPGGVLDVCSDGEVEEVVGAVAQRAELVDHVLPMKLRLNF